MDAGTGLRSLTARLGGRPYSGAVLLSHLHWDHVQGLPFFAAGDRDDARVHLLLPAQDGRSGRDLLAQTLSPPVGVDYGHCTVQDAVALAVESGAGTLLLFHHAPTRSDDALDEIGRWAADIAPDLRVLVAREGDVLDVLPHSPVPVRAAAARSPCTSGPDVSGSPTR